jgi:hypothetical protein
MVRKSNASKEPKQKVRTLKTSSPSGEVVTIVQSRWKPVLKRKPPPCLKGHKAIRILP